MKGEDKDGDANDVNDNDIGDDNHNHKDDKSII